MAKTALFGQTRQGVMAIEDNSRTTGNRFFVDTGSATGGTTSGFGQSPDKPFTTLDSAIGNCTVNNGDFIYVMPGSADTVSAAAGLDLDVAGITIIGIGNGSDQPTVTLDTIDSADVDVDAANITVENIHFVANVQDIVAAIDVNADDFTLRNCRFTDNSGTLNAKIWVQDGATGTSDRITIEGCRCNTLGTANTHFLNLAGTGEGHIIRNNILSGDWATMCLGGAGLVTQCSIIGNYILNIAAGADLCISMGATATGICAGNMCTGGHATQGIIPGDLGALENYYEPHTADTSGTIEPGV